MNRNRSTVGFVILAIFMILLISGSVVVLREWRKGPAQTGQRHPLPRLGYCSPGQPGPCVVSFHLAPGGEMVIDLQIEKLSSPDFNLRIKREESESLYGCRRTDRFSLSVICTGEAMPAGEQLQFLVLAKKDNTLLAEGRFAILGLALATPEYATTPTAVPLFNRPPR